LPRMRLNSPQNVSFLTLVLLIIFVWTGYHTAYLRPLWNDEIYTQFYSIHSRSFASLIIGQTSEGNNAPLFYMIQKAIVNVFHFQTPAGWEGQALVIDPQAQIILRIQSIIFISLAMCLSFYYFATIYSFMSAVLVVSLYLSSTIIWIYWAEGRPYGLWIFLTAAHTLFLMGTVKKNVLSQKDKWILLLLNVLLALTTVFSIFQIIASSIILFGLKERNIKSLIQSLSIPGIISLYYYIQTRQNIYPHWLNSPPLDLFFDTVSKEQFIFLFIYLLLTLAMRHKKSSPSGPESQFQFIYAASIAICFLMLLLSIVCHAHYGPKGFALSNRYFSCLVPIFAITIGLLFQTLMNAFVGEKIMRFNIILVASFVVLITLAEQKLVGLTLINLYLNL
jgi:hypothetical protein